MTIIAKYDPPPILQRQFDWSAVEDGYEPGCPIGYGRTRQEAVADLLEQCVRENNRINDALGGFDNYVLGYYVAN